MAQKQENSTFDENAKVADSIYQAGKSVSTSQVDQLTRELHQASRKLESAKVVSELAGKAKAFRFIKGIADLSLILTLRQVKEDKTYRTDYGMTWDDFCDYIGIPRRTADRWLDETESLSSEFLASCPPALGMEINKIKYLSKAISGHMAEITPDNALVIDGEEIPFTPEHKEDIEAALSRLAEATRKQKEEHESTVRAKDRLLEAKDKVIHKQEKELSRLEKQITVTDLSPEDQELIDLLSKVQADLMAGISEIKSRVPYASGSPVALRHYYFLLIFIQKLARDERLDLAEHYRDAEECPWEIYEDELPPPDVLIDNSPLTRGMGAAYRSKLAAHAPESDTLPDPPGPEAPPGPAPTGQKQGD